MPRSNSVHCKRQNDNEKMNVTIQSPKRNFRSLACCFAVLLLIAPTQDASTQDTPALTGSTLGTNLRNAAGATLTQLNVLLGASDNFRRRAGSANYNQDQFRHDFGHVQSQFQTLRTQFNWVAELALQLGRARANNAVAELDAGLEIIGEPLGFLHEQFTAGTLDRTTIVRTVGVFQKALGEWEREFRKNTSRLQLAF